MSQSQFDLDYLLHHKGFEELNAAERESVLAEVDRASFEALRATIVETQSHFQHAPTGLTPSPETERKLLQRMRKSRLARSAAGIGLFRFLSYQVPAYQAVAATALLVFGLYFLDRPPLNQGYVPSHSIMIADSTDSVKTRKEGINLEEDTVFSRFLIEAM